MRTALTILWVVVMVLSARTQTPTQNLTPASLIQKSRSTGNTLQPIAPFSIINEGRSNFPVTELQNSKYELLQLDEEKQQQLLAEAPEFFTLSLPSLNREILEVELVRVDLFRSDFSVRESGRSAPQIVDPGLHYRGIIKGVPSSIATLSVFDDEMIGLFSSDALGNLSLGKMKTPGRDGTEAYLLYPDREIFAREGFYCETPDGGDGYTADELRATPEAGRDVGDCVGIYFEVDYNIYQDKGSSASVTNYVTGLFNQVAALYANEDLNAVISEIYIWTTPSPYGGSSSSAMLNQFQNTRTSFNGDLGQLLSYSASGGIAVLNGICHPYTFARLSFASVGSTYTTVPTYSWSTMVVAHELGHLFGSHHTHACVWNGNNTAIDGCAGGTEGSCANPGYPAGGGTVMSYCHITSVGINFSQGFGVQPGNVMRNRVSAASCLDQCDTGGGGGDGGGGSGGGGDGGGGDGGGGSGGDDNTSSCSENEVFLMIKLDLFGMETTWKLLNESGETIYSGGPYLKKQSGEVKQDTFCLANECYTFVILDSDGDGICCEYGQGSYTLLDRQNQALAAGGEFGQKEVIDFCLPFTPDNNTDCVNINFNDYTINSYGGSQDRGTHQLMSSGTVLKIQKNAWKSIALDYDITANTVLEFDFGSTIEGEIHGIGFDDDNSISYGLTFKLHGFQAWGITDYDNYPGGAVWKSYTIPVGQYYYGQADRLFFCADHDVAPQDGNAYFRNVRIYEGDGCEGIVAEELEEDNLLPPDDAGAAAGFYVFPNPAKSQLTLDLQQIKGSGNSRLQIYNAMGSILRESSIDAGQSTHQLNVSDLPAGTYFIRLDTGGKSYVEKFTITRA